MKSPWSRLRNRLVRWHESRIRAHVSRRVVDAAPPAPDATTPTAACHPERDFFVRTEASPDIAHVEQICAKARFGLFSRRWPAVPDGGAGCVRFRPDGFDVDVPPGTPRRWVFFQQKNPVPEPCSLSFDFTLGSEFTEFQIPFRIRHLARRCRFILVDNRSLNFEVVDRGCFLRGIRSVPLRLEIGRNYHAEVRFCKDAYAFSLDGRPILSVQIGLPWMDSSPDPFGIIFFEKSKGRRIRVPLSHMAIGRRNGETTNPGRTA